MKYDPIFDGEPETTLPALGINGDPKAIVLTCEQRTQQWFTARIGIPTASRLGDFLKHDGTASRGQTRQSYINKLVAERLLGYVEPEIKMSVAMERGVELEPRARDWYSFEYGKEVKQVGLVTEPKRRWACSPDGLISEHGVEIKCPLHKEMIAVLRSEYLPAKYYLQPQFSMWVCGLPRWDVVFYTPEDEIPNRVFVLKADADLQITFAKELPALCAEIESAVEVVKNRGMKK